MSVPMLVLDGSVSPYLPTREILDAMALRGAEQPVHELARMLKERLALLHGVRTERLALFPHDVARIDPLLALHGDAPLVTYAPTDEIAGSIEIQRSTRFRIEAAQIETTPRGSIALVTTPNDPTGTATHVTSAAQLARRATVLVLDERSAEMQHRSMIPLVEEFDSIVLMRSFADWAGLGVNAPAYAITTRRLAVELDRPDLLDTNGLHAALAAISNADQLDAIAQRVRLERLRLYRMLRKVNFVAPFPSDAGYVLAEVTRGERDLIWAALAERGISAYAPQQPRLQQTLRFSAISPAATKTLQAALVDISRTVLG